MVKGKKLNANFDKILKYVQQSIENELITFYMPKKSKVKFTETSYFW